MKTDSKRIKLSKSKREALINKTISFIILALICVAWAFPFIYLFGMSVKSQSDFVLHPESFFPSSLSEWTWDNYTGFFGQKGNEYLIYSIFNSIISTAINIVIVLIITTFAAYSLVFLRCKGTKFIFVGVIASMTIPGVIGLAPMFSAYVALGKSLDALNSAWYVISWLAIPGVAGGFNLLIMVNCFKSIPKELVESARSDGAKEFTVFRRVVLPLAKSSILIIALFSFNGTWNSYQFPLLMCSVSTDNTLRTVTILISQWIGGTEIQFKGIGFSASVLSLIPLLIAYMFVQNRIIDGVANTGVKK